MQRHRLLSITINWLYLTEKILNNVSEVNQLLLSCDCKDSTRVEVNDYFYVITATKQKYKYESEIDKIVKL
jgi:hypothetical protein